MKKIRFVLFLLTTGIFLVGGCKKDDDDSNNNSNSSNYFSIDGTRYSIEKGYLADGGIWLFSNGLSITGIVDFDPVVEGSGNAFVIREAGDFPIQPGSYTFGSMEGAVITNWVTSTESWDYQQYIPNGTGLCTINYTDLNYEVDVDGTFEDGNKIIVKFSGTLLNIIE